MQQQTSTAPHPIDSIIAQLGDAGRRLTEIDASEGAAGNLSVYLRGPFPAPPQFSEFDTIDLPMEIPELAEDWFVVTGSGARLREIERDPGACLGCLKVNADGRTGTLLCAKQRVFSRLTSEFNSHLVVHRNQISKHGLGFHAVVHAQPRKITYLSHLDAYGDGAALNKRLMRWQPEAILNFPEGIALVPFLVPGTAELMKATEQALLDCRIVVWAKHGVMARSRTSVLGAVDLIEYLETAAAYECLDRMLGGSAVGLSSEQIRAISGAYGVDQKLF